MKKLTKQELKDKKILAEFYKQNSKNTNLSEYVFKLIPSEYKLDILQCIYAKPILTLVVSNQLSASKIRYLLPQLKNQLQANEFFHSLRKIRLQINTQHQPKTAIPQNISKPVYSNTSASLLLSLSNSIDSKGLQESLQKLARHIKSN